LKGAFTFARADLNVFKGIAGTLSARGTFGGSLERIVVEHLKAGRIVEEAVFFRLTG